jgi:hypothetical protein
VADDKKADWSEWGRFTLTALGGNPEFTLCA